uniref:Intraflagellar transport protein 56 n=1 Tax=Setaria digitata TaxID=48799 RepID=A0A915PQ81_9BILA
MLTVKRPGHSLNLIKLVRALCTAKLNTNIPEGLREFFDNPVNYGKDELDEKNKPGRPWSKDELRLKSNSDLHKLWYVLLKERNMLLTMQEACVQKARRMPNPDRIEKVSESMYNLEFVIHERNDAYFRLETGDGADPPLRTITSFAGFTYKKRATEHLTPPNEQNVKEYEVPYLDDDAYLMQKLWAEKEHAKQRDALDDEVRRRRLSENQIKHRRSARSYISDIAQLKEVKELLLSRLRPSWKKSEQKLKSMKIPELDEFLQKRDYIGAMSLLQACDVLPFFSEKFQSKDENTDDITELWLGHCVFHAGEYRQAIAVRFDTIYERMLMKKNCSPEVNIYIACCFFFLGMCAEAKQYAEKGPKCALQNRLLFHIAYRLKDEKQLLAIRSNLQDTAEDQLSLAAMHYLRSHYQEAIDIYKKILASKKNFVALNVYLALCYYKLDEYDISLEFLQIYLDQNPDSAIAINLRACNHYKLYNGKVAEKELRQLQNGKALDSVILKTRNLEVRTDASEENDRCDMKAALGLVSDMDPQHLIEFLLKAITYCTVGYQKKSKEYLEIAQKHFRVVGESASECGQVDARFLGNLTIFDFLIDTIAGRQAMASSYFLSSQFDEVLIYLNSIRSYFYNDDTFNFNIGQALLACGNSAEAEASLVLVVDEEMKKKPTYFLSLARAYIQNGKSNLAWEMSVNMRNSDDILKLLSLIANDCYRVGDYFYSVKAFDAMERIEPNPQYWEGKRGAAIGVFKLVVEQKVSLVFANRSVYLQKIRYYGFDMDFTLAIYKSPDYDILLYNNIINRLILLGYPEQLRDFPYEKDFAIRGLWFDRTFGNLLKVDGFGNILVGIHGYNYLQRSDIKKHYPNKFISLRHLEKVLVMNSLFDIAHTYVLTTLIHYFDNHKDYERTSDGTGVQSGDTIISYKSLAEDVLSAVNYSSLKVDVLQNLDKYIIKDNRVKPLLQQINAHGGRTFLLTNSNYNYTNGILTYLIGPDWTSYFDVSIVDAKKPLWFMKGTVFRQIDTATGTPKIGVHQGILKKGDVYAGGNSDDFRRLFNARDREVLYIGDHIFGDVLKSKKTKGWRTFLVIPELVKEITIWSQQHNLFEKMIELTKQVEEMYNQINTESVQSSIQEGNTQIRERTQEMDNYYSKMGSLFRSGPRTTFFASQVERFADLYSSSCYNLLYYPLFYFFHAPMTLMPHEMNIDECIRGKHFSASGKSRKSMKTIPHVQEDTIALTDEEFLVENNDDGHTSSETE